MEKLSHQAPIYIVMEGSEPLFFTRHFSWDSTKSAVSVFMMFAYDFETNLLIENTLADARKLIPKKAHTSEEWRPSTNGCKFSSHISLFSFLSSKYAGKDYYGFVHVCFLSFFYHLNAVEYDTSFCNVSFRSVVGTAKVKDVYPSNKIKLIDCTLFQILL